MKYGCTIAKVGTYFAQWKLVIQFEYKKSSSPHFTTNSELFNSKYRYFSDYFDAKNDNETTFLTFLACFLIPILFSNLNCKCSNLSYVNEKPPGTS